MTQRTESKRARSSQARPNKPPKRNAQHDDNAYALRIIPLKAKGLHTRHVAWCEGDCKYAGSSGTKKATMKRSATKELNILGYIIGLYCDACAKAMKKAYEDAANGWQPQESI